jgi:site-specific DNA recombinase
MARTRIKPGTKDIEPTRIAAYVRVSTEDQANSGLGIEAQKSRCTAMATVKGWPAPVFYADEGVSGTKAKRPQLDRLLADVEAGNLDAVIILSLDRLGRETRLILDLVAQLTERAILVSCKESFDTTTPQGQFVLTIFAAFSQLERDLISQRTAAALHERSKRDGNIGRLPYGSVRTPDGVAVDPVAAAVVQHIFALRQCDLSLRAIAADLNQQGHRPPYSSTRWHHTGVREIILNLDAYRGGNRGASAQRWPLLFQTKNRAA